MCTQHEGTVSGPVHPEHTTKSRYCYFFYTKHHNPADTDAAQWHPELSRADEFAVFDLADANGIECKNHHLYGVRLIGGRPHAVGPLGTLYEQVAVFQFTRPPTPWHGFPMWPLARQRAGGGRDYPAPREALRRLAVAGLITENQRRRLAGGSHV